MTGPHLVQLTSGCDVADGLLLNKEIGLLLALPASMCRRCCAQRRLSEGAQRAEPGSGALGCGPSRGVP